MSTPGYYRYPAIDGDDVIFVADDDLWTVPAAGGTARRLTANDSAIAHPYVSPDGRTVALSAREEGHLEVYTMPSRGGPLRRITFLGATSKVVGWTADGEQILFVSDAGQPFARISVLHAVPAAGGAPTAWSLGPVVSLSVGEGGRMALGRNSDDPARWKRYRGGTAGEIWVDPDGGGEFRPLIRLGGNIGRPMWIGPRIYFLSDHEGIGNIYSCTPDGEDLRRHTHHDDYFARFPNTDGARIVYHAGADLYLFDPATDRAAAIEIDYHSPRAQRSRKFVDAGRYLESYAPHPQGHSLALCARGKSFALGNWEGAVIAQEAAPDRGPVRCRLSRFLGDGERLVMMTDRTGEERLEIHAWRGGHQPDELRELDVGQVDALKVSPAADHVLVSNHRNELLFVDLEARTLRRVARSEFGPIAGFDWSPDGAWVAFGLPISLYQTAIYLWHRDTGELHAATDPVLRDVEPSFDPEGRYLYFLGFRELNPVYDHVHFALGFPRGMRPYLLTLREDEPSPFVPRPRPLDDRAEPSGPGKPDADSAQKAEPSHGAITIDTDGLPGRIVAFPVPENLYVQVAGIEGKVLFSSLSPEGALDHDFFSTAPEAKATLESYEFATQKREQLASEITDFQLSRDGKTLVYRAGNRLRAIRAGHKADDGQAGPGRESGWIDLGRVKVSVEPGAEWRQMALEAWRLQRDHFWTEDMSKVDWSAIWSRYEPLLDRVGTRGEFSDLMWEMQGELGTSHAYEIGGDYRPPPSYPQGFLGADFRYDGGADAWVIDRVVRGTPGDAEADSPLGAPGVGVRAGDRLRAINGRPVTRESPPGALLVHQAGEEVALTVEREDGKTRETTVKTLSSEQRARYREWVEQNRRAVHEASGGRLGYVHIPDMGPNGFAEFHRLYLVEAAKAGLVVDIRFNGGGHVSQLIVEKLARRPLGYDVSRWGRPEPYPLYAVPGPLVAVTNEWAGSDGDIASHVFKLLKLGPLVGKRTWGGVIGISPRRALSDGAVTTQPEHSFWFKDVGWGVENYGTEPDVEVDVAPHDYARGRDPQLERAIAIALERLAQTDVELPAFGDRPNLAPPKLRDP